MLGVAERVVAAVIVDEVKALGDTDADGVADPETLNETEPLAVTDTDSAVECVALEDAMADAPLVEERDGVWIGEMLGETLVLVDAVAETELAMLCVAELVAATDTVAEAVAL
jgi:hypothetical protein